jgi:hypothetical protein
VGYSARFFGRSRSAVPATGAEEPGELGEVEAGGGAEADHRNSEHPTVTDREFVLSVGIRQDLGRLEVMDSVDLDNHTV